MLDPTSARRSVPGAFKSERGLSRNPQRFTVVIAPNAPPEPRVEVRPAPPGPSVVWMGGNWRWAPAEKNFVWVPGKYVEPPRAQAAWVPGRWIHRPDGWVFEDGRWD